MHIVRAAKGWIAVSDLISKEKVLQCIMASSTDIDWGQSEDGDAFKHYAGTLYRTIASLECMPPVDAVQVVRCKDCKHYDGDNCCMKNGLIVRDDGGWFCADGENGLCNSKRHGG